jgi:hypothetical protein
MTTTAGASIDGLNGAGVLHLLDSHPVGAEVAVAVERGYARTTVHVRRRLAGTRSRVIASWPPRLELAASAV